MYLYLSSMIKKYNYVLNSNRLPVNENFSFDLIPDKSLNKFSAL